MKNYLKVVFVPEDICEMTAAVLRSNCLTVQHFNYASSRHHNSETTLTYHAEKATTLDFTIRINNADCGKMLLTHMLDSELHAYSFIFNATFMPTGRLLDFDDAMMTQGYIIDIQEEFHTQTETGQAEQMLMHVRLLLNSVTFLGKEDNLQFET